MLPIGFVFILFFFFFAQYFFDQFLCCWCCVNWGETVIGTMYYVDFSEWRILFNCVGNLPMCFDEPFRDHHHPWCRCWCKSINVSPSAAPCTVDAPAIAIYSHFPCPLPFSHTHTLRVSTCCIDQSLDRGVNDFGNWNQLINAVTSAFLRIFLVQSDFSNSH